MAHHPRRDGSSGRPSLSFFVVLALVLALLPAASLPTAAVAADVSTSHGRLIVVWRGKAPASLSIQGVERTQRGGNARRSLIVAAPGQTDAVVQRMRMDPRVAAILPDTKVSIDAWPTSGSPDDTYYGSHQPGLVRIGMPAAWPITVGDPGVIVAVLDTGLHTDHVDLDGVPIISPRNEITDTADVRDGHGHGTHVTGTIAAETNNGIGVAGVAPGVSIMPIKVLGDDGSGYFSDILDGIDWARANGATVVNMSLGGSLSSSAVAYFQPTIDTAVAAGITLVAAAGNNGTSAISYPGGFAGVLAVGATTDSDVRASFSQTNATVDLMAPGVNTLATRSRRSAVRAEPGRRSAGRPKPAEPSPSPVPAPGMCACGQWMLPAIAAHGATAWPSSQRMTGRSASAPAPFAGPARPTRTARALRRTMATRRSPSSSPARHSTSWP